MKYTTTIQGMHCPSCKKLIQMTMEDLHLSSIVIDETTGQCTFEYAGQQENLAQIFTDLKKELPDYTYLIPQQL